MNTSYTTGDEEDGHGKTLYMHVLRYYIPKMMLDTFQKHGVGPGVFTMEGFEYVNYVSKMVHRTRTNKKGNTASQALPVLAMMFVHQDHDVKTVLKERHLRSERLRRRQQGQIMREDEILETAENGDDELSQSITTGPVAL